jgi:predicted nucleotidyltransferase
VAIPVASWADFQRLRESMSEGSSPRFRITNIPHKFIHIETTIEVDIVPFGVIGEPDQLIEWADGNKMNVMGLKEALMHASLEKIDALELRIVGLPAFIVLKLFAWDDRKGRTNKDLKDIEFILEHYSDDNRVYEELTQELAEGQVEYLDAAIYLLGQDIRKIFLDETITQINVILEQLTDNPDDEASDFVKRLKVLQGGINMKYLNVCYR